MPAEITGDAKTAYRALMKRRAGTMKGQAGRAGAVKPRSLGLR